MLIARIIRVPRPAWKELRSYDLEFAHGGKVTVPMENVPTCFELCSKIDIYLYYG